MNRKAFRFVHADKYAAEVEIELIPDAGAWGPYISRDDALKLDRVRSAQARRHRGRQPGGSHVPADAAFGLKHAGSLRK